MIVITASGRLAHQPEAKMLPSGSSVVEFRLLSNRFSQGNEIVEAVTFFCYGELAERFCERAEKGQVVMATGTQETQTYTDGSGQQRSFVKYRLSSFELGSKPFRGERQEPQAYRGNAAQQNRDNFQQRNQRQNAPSQGQYQPRRAPAPAPAYSGHDESGFPQGHYPSDADDSPNMF